MGMGDQEEAARLFGEVLVINPENKTARSAASQSRQQLEKTEGQVKQVFRGMFDKFAAQDTQACRSRIDLCCHEYLYARNSTQSFDVII